MSLKCWVGHNPTLTTSGAITDCLCVRKKGGFRVSRAHSWPCRRKHQYTINSSLKRLRFFLPYTHIHIKVRHLSKLAFYLSLHTGFALFLLPDSSFSFSDWISELHSISFISPPPFLYFFTISKVPSFFWFVFSFRVNFWLETLISLIIFFDFLSALRYDSNFNYLLCHRVSLEWAEREVESVCVCVCVSFCFLLFFSWLGSVCLLVLLLFFRTKIKMQSLLESRMLIDVALYTFNPFFCVSKKEPFSCSFLCVLYRADISTERMNTVSLGRIRWGSFKSRIFGAHLDFG